MAAGPGFERTARHGIERRDPDQRDGGEQGEEGPVEREQLLLEPDVRPFQSFGEQRLIACAPSARGRRLHFASNAVLSADRATEPQS